MIVRVLVDSEADKKDWQHTTHHFLQFIQFISNAIQYFFKGSSILQATSQYSLYLYSLQYLHHNSTG